MAKAHSWHSGFTFGTRLDDFYGQPFSGNRFFNLFHCSSAKTSQRNLAFGMAVGSTHGLASVGPTHTGAMLANEIFEQHLADGLSWGQALRHWIITMDAYNSSEYDAWSAGMTAYGDPNVRMRGGRTRTTSGAGTGGEAADADADLHV